MAINQSSFTVPRSPFSLLEVEVFIKRSDTTYLWLYNNILNGCTDVYANTSGRFRGGGGEEGGIQLSLSRQVRPKEGTKSPITPPSHVCFFSKPPFWCPFSLRNRLFTRTPGRNPRVRVNFVSFRSFWPRYGKNKTVTGMF